jgi:phosphatidylglycerophosphatase A
MIQRFIHPIRVFIVKALASGLFLSYIPYWALKHQRFSGAGLVGTFWGLALVRWLPFEPVREIMVWAGACFVSIAISDYAEEYYGNKDDQRIVLDEFAGYWTAVLFLPRPFIALATAFVLFRLFDTLKPSFIRRSGNLPGGWGVVVDDILAGAAANLVLQAVRLIKPF